MHYQRATSRELSCGTCGYTVNSSESEHYSKHTDGHRSVDDDNDNVGADSSKYDSMLVQSNNNDYCRQAPKAEENRRPQMTSQRQQYQQQQYSENWAYQDLKRDIEADGQRRVIEINDPNDNNPRFNKIKRPTTY